jgi:hypothetical protein
MIILSLCPFFTEDIQQSQKPSLKVMNILEDKLLDLFIGTLKESIQNEVCLFKPKSLNFSFNVANKFESKHMATRRVASNTYRDQHHVPSPNLTQPTRLTPQ